MYFLIRTSKGKKLYSDLPEELVPNAMSFNKEFSYGICDVWKKEKREGLLTEGQLELYICCFDSSKTNKIFKHQLKAAAFFLEAYANSYKQTVESETKKTRRLKHNLSTYHSKIHQELFKLVPQDKISRSKQNQREMVKNIILKNPDHAVTTFLRVLKNANLIKSEFDVYETLHSPNPNIDPQLHSIHRVITLSLSSFWLDFIDKGISINLDQCNGDFLFDYKSMSSILCHIFDNGTKYIANGTELKISTDADDQYDYILFEMTSLRVKKDELDKIYEDGFSSEYSEKLGFAGTGVGMNVIKSLAAINNLIIDFNANVDPSRSIEKLGVPFDFNILRIGIKKALNN